MGSGQGLEEGWLRSGRDLRRGQGLEGRWLGKWAGLGGGRAGKADSWGKWAEPGENDGRVGGVGGAGEWAGLVRRVGPGRGRLTLLFKVTSKLVGNPPAPAVSAPGIPERGRFFGGHFLAENHAGRRAPLPLRRRRSPRPGGRPRRLSLGRCESASGPTRASSIPRAAPGGGAERASWRVVEGLRSHSSLPALVFKACLIRLRPPGSPLPSPRSPCSFLTVLCIWCQRSRSRFPLSESRPHPAPLSLQLGVEAPGPAGVARGLHWVPGPRKGT